jgi:hypothetical protein
MYFSHDFYAMQDPKMVSLLAECGLGGVGLYWIIVEILHQQDDGYIAEEQLMDLLSFYCREANAKQVLEHVLAKCSNLFLLEKDGNFITSKRVLENKERMLLLSERRSTAGRKGGQTKAVMKIGSKRLASAKHLVSKIKQNKIKEKNKEEVITTLEEIEKEKEKTACRDWEVVEYWNTKFKHKVLALSRERKEKLSARLKSQHFVDNYKVAVDKVAVSSFCNGDNDRKWVASFDWFIANDNNYVKALEGKYDDTEEKIKQRRLAEILL